MPVPTLHAVNTATTYCRANRLFQAWPLIVAKPNADLVPLGVVPEEDPLAERTLTPTSALIVVVTVIDLAGVRICPIAAGVTRAAAEPIAGSGAARA
jgi:hypothetical protein